MALDPRQRPRIVVIGGTLHSSALHTLGALSGLSGHAILVCTPRLDAAAARQTSAFPVIEVVDRAKITADHVYLLPSDRRTSLRDGDLVVGARTTAPFDNILREVAEKVGRNAVGVVLAGTGADGSLGIKRVKEAGGLTIAEQGLGRDAALPNAAINTGLVDVVLPIDRIAAQIAMLDRHDDDALEEIDDHPADSTADTLRDVLALVRVRTGHDFSAYKRATLYRRIARRMQVCECGTLEVYHRYLRDHPPELGHLLRDFLISVTNFMRDPPAFAVIASEVIPLLFAAKTATEQVRVWVPGCATGEEAYSLGILLLEYAAHRPNPPTLQVFATDIDETALAEARLGVYPEAIAADLSPERLQRFFVRDNGQYRVTRELRELVLFSPHNILRDPPFSRLDLISCRNVLIYLNREAQSRVLNMFHFGLRPEGFLFLGSSESAESVTTFGPLDPKHRVFMRRAAPASLGDMAAATARWQVAPTAPTAYRAERAASLGELHYKIIEHFSPPSVLVDQDLEIVHLSENAGKFLRLAGGEPSRQVLRLVHPALRLELRTAIYAARQHGRDARAVTYDDDGVTRTVVLRVRAADLPELGGGALTIAFDAREGAAEPVVETRTPSPSIEPVVREIEDELNRTRDQLRTTIEQYETSLEELKASNEELQAINEELRSATEELETSKEELQSVNEELTTLNHELKVKLEEIGRANSDLQNLMSSTEIGVVFLDRRLHIKRYTPRMVDVLNILPSDVGRPFAHVTHRLIADDLADTAAVVLQSLRTIERALTTRDGRPYLVRWLPYRSTDGRFDGVVITFVDVSDLRDAVAARRGAETALRLVEERLRVALRDAPMVVLAFDRDATPTWAYVLGRELPADDRDPLSILGAGDRQRLEAMVRQVAAERAGRRIELSIGDGDARRTFDFRVEPSATGVTGVGFDITPSKLAESSLRETDRRKDEFLATLSHELRNPLAPMKIAIEVARMLDDDPVRRAQSLEVMDRQVTMLSQLVDELLDLSRITQNKVQLDRVILDVERLVENAVEVTRPLLTAGQHTLTVHSPSHPVTLVGDERRLIQVLTNLLTNATRYTPTGGTIDVDIDAEDGTGHVAIRITDNGVGIASESLPRIFEIFVQSRDDEGRSQGGLGIGLNVVQRLVEMHGGTVRAQSDGVGRGSSFTVDLPIKIESE